MLSVAHAKLRVHTYCDRKQAVLIAAGVQNGVARRASQHLARVRDIDKPAAVVTRSVDRVFRHGEARLLRLGRLRFGRLRRCGCLGRLRGLGLRSDLRPGRLLWVQHAGGDEQHREHRRGNAHGELRLFPFDGGLYAALCIAFAEGHGARRGEARQLRKGEQGLGIVLFEPLAALREHALVAALLHIAAHQHKAEPDDGIEPVDSEHDESECLDDVVAALYMAVLVGEHAVERRAVKPVGDDDPRAEQAEDIGR